MGPCGKVPKEEGKVIVGFNMAHVGIAQCAAQQSSHRQHYASLGVGLSRPIANAQSLFPHKVITFLEF